MRGETPSFPCFQQCCCFSLPPYSCLRMRLVCNSCESWSQCIISRCGIRDKLLRGSRPRRQTAGQARSEMVLCLAHVIATCCMRREPWRPAEITRKQASKHMSLSCSLPSAIRVCSLARGPLSLSEMGLFPRRGTRTCLFRQVASTFGGTHAVGRHLCVSPAVKHYCMCVFWLGPGLGGRAESFAFIGSAFRRRFLGKFDRVFAYCSCVFPLFFFADVPFLFDQG